MGMIILDQLQEEARRLSNTESRTQSALQLAVYRSELWVYSVGFMSHKCINVVHLHSSYSKKLKKNIVCYLYSTKWQAKSETGKHTV